MNVIEYCTEEVQRQGHDTTVLDGIERVGWMLDAWSYAIALSSPRPGYLGQRPILSDVESLGRRAEPKKNKDGFRSVRVRVGPRICPEPDQVPRLLKLLFEQRDVLSPFEWYKEFELIHPFVDGNGRTGKILLAWLDDRLLNPDFPPKDLFGDWIENP
jgi:hypothetical protein